MTKYKRKTISKKTRFEIFKRDSFACQYCSARPPEVPLELDHIIPISKGGSNDIDNLITACFDCNRGKSDRDLKVSPQKLSEKIEQAKIAKKQYKEYLKVLNEKIIITNQEIEKVEEIYSTFFDGWVFTDRFKTSVKKFNQKLGVESVMDAMEVSCSRMNSKEKALKYFCGICWNLIKKGEENEWI